LNSNFDLESLTNSQNDALITDLLDNNDGFDDILRNINPNVFQGNIQTNSYTMMPHHFQCRSYPTVMLPLTLILIQNSEFNVFFFTGIH
jgi:hypothetical protein